MSIKLTARSSSRIGSSPLFLRLLVIQSNNKMTIWSNSSFGMQMNLVKYYIVLLLGKSHHKGSKLLCVKAITHGYTWFYQSKLKYAFRNERNSPVKVNPDENKQIHMSTSPDLQRTKGPRCNGIFITFSFKLKSVISAEWAARGICCLSGLISVILNRTAHLEVLFNTYPLPVPWPSVRLRCSETAAHHRCGK